MHAHQSRRRILAAAVLAALAHLLALPIVAAVVLGHIFAAGKPPSEQPKVSYVEVPAADWDAARRVTTPGVAPAPDPRGTKVEKSEQAKKPEPKEEKPAGQTVVVPPGNEQDSPDARFSAETDNRVEKESIARERRPSKVTMPKTTVTEKPPPAKPGKPGESVVIGDPGEGRDEKRGEKGNALEIPKVDKSEKVALPEDPKGSGSVRNRPGSEAVAGNSDRFRIQVGEGEDEEEGAGASASGGGDLARLFPDRGMLDRVAGAAAPDHVEGVEEGDATFLNTREWKYASFFVRLKKSLGDTWDPVGALRKRDPSGEIYAWRDRYTLLSVTLRPDGGIADVYVQQSSGVDFLDHEAIAAFRRAQPFPNPPSGMQDENGLIRFNFGFFVETGRAGIRIFR